MDQPELGKKIAELRKAKGFTQEELVEKCKLSVRTLQRIESGEVTPRSFTLKTIFAELNYSISDLPGTKINATSEAGSDSETWTGQIYGKLLDIVNFKKNPMKKISVLTVFLLMLSISLYAIYTRDNAREAKQITKTILDLQNKVNKWVNEGKVDSVLTLYRDDATVMPFCSNKNEIREMLKSALEGGYKLIEFKTLSVSAGDSVAVQRYFDVYEFQGAAIKQQGMTEWRLTKGKWLIVNDTMVNY